MTYPNFVDLTVEAAFSSATATYGQWDDGLWDTATWGPDIVWLDITQWVLEIQGGFGRQRETDHFQAGLGYARLDNSDARFSPANLAGPYVAGGVTGVRPLRPLRITGVWAGVTYPIAYGVLGDPDETWIDGEPGEITLPFTDGLSVLANYNGPAQVAQGAGELTGLRIQRILANAGWTLPTNVNPGTVTCQATTLAQNALTELYLTSDSEGGAMWCDPDGSFVFENQYALVENSRSRESQATFGDRPALDELPYAEPPKPTYSRDVLANQAAIGRAGGTQQTAYDLTSMALYGARGPSRTDLVCQSDLQCAALAAWTVARYAQPEYRFRSITIDPMADPTNLWPQVLGRRIRDRVTVNRRPFSSTALTITNDAFIDGISFNFTPGRWRTTFQLASATAYQQFGLWDATDAMWDTSKFFY